LERIGQWFLEHRRDFPWREEMNPYRVWVSEVMLQQTRAQVVIPYFIRWMERFPDIWALAEASVEEVIKAWEGLGYYSRARNLHGGAQQIVKEFGGQIPDSREALLRIRGLGPYTSAAILSFGFHKRVAPVDGNVLRLMSRYFWIAEDVGKSRVRNKIEEAAEGLLDEEQPWITAEGMIELGATVCTPKPRCESCPLQSGCQAFERKNPEALPIRSRVERVERIARGVAVLRAKGKVLVRKNPPGQLMGDLYEFPYFEGKISSAAVAKELKTWMGMKIELIEKLPAVEHSFTRFLAKLYPYLFEADVVVEVEGFSWVQEELVAELPFSSGHRKIMRGL